MQQNNPMQLALLKKSVPKEYYDYGTRSDGGVHGAVLTRPDVVGFMLDLIGYSTDKDLTTKSVLEPSCGEGAFLYQIVERLVTSAKKYEKDYSELKKCIKAFDIDRGSILTIKEGLRELLVVNGVPKDTAIELVDGWICEADFLLASVEGLFDYVVGNPPYVRIEQIHPDLFLEYRTLFKTLYDRADLYVAFIEKSLGLLSKEGQLSFVCANRWTQNKYGSQLRELISSSYHVSTFINLLNASPFETEVIAYPCIFVIGKSPHRFYKNRIIQIENKDIDFNGLAEHLKSGAENNTQYKTFRVDTWFKGSEPWILTSAEQIDQLRYFEDNFQPIENQNKTFVRIGIATGCDDLLIIKGDSNIERDRLVPLVMREDLKNGNVYNGKHFVINTFDSDGIVELKKYPKLEAYLESGAEKLRERHVAKKTPAAWYRTIDRIVPAHVERPKLLIPDIADVNSIVFDKGHYYPHHNLYYVISDEWDVEVLGALLSSKIALFFIWSYAPKMRGNFLRFQAQYLRKIRLPKVEELPTELQQALKTAFRKRDFEAIDALSCQAYKIEESPKFDFIDRRK